MQLGVNTKASAMAPTAATPAGAGSLCDGDTMQWSQYCSQRTVNMVVSAVSCTEVAPQGSNYRSGPHWAKHCTNTQQEQGRDLPLKRCYAHSQAP